MPGDACPWLVEFCTVLPGCEREWKQEWDAYRYLLGDKMFALEGTHKDGRAILTVKLHPDHGDQLRQDYEHVIPGYYMNKVHWNSVYLDGDVPDDVIQAMITESYELVLASLPTRERDRLSSLH